jgi:DNA-binding beta-propeller fold protein YncE
MKVAEKINYALLFALSFVLLSFTSTNASSISLIAQIPIPNWAVTANPSPPPPLLTNASFDLLSFDPNRQIMYSADRPNKGVDVIDTKTNTLLGIIPIPNACPNGGTSCPSGVEVAANVKQLIVTDRGATNGGIFIYDLTNSATPSAPVKTITLANARASDELSYDPINKRAYVNNTSNTGDPLGRYFMTVIDVNPASATFGQVLGQIPIASGANSPEQPRFDPADGFIYTTTGGNSTLLRINPNFVLDPNNPANNLGAIVKTIQLPGCSPAGFDVNPADNFGLLGCNPGAPNGFPQELINLNTDTIVRQIPGITATDVLAFDPSLGEWFTASQNLVNSNGCPASQANAAQFPQVGGILDNPNPGLQVACSGQGAHGLGVDPVHNFIYVPVGVFPSNGSLGLNSFAGILVFQATAVPEPSSLLLMAFGLIGMFTYTYRRSVQK